MATAAATGVITSQNSHTADDLNAIFEGLTTSAAANTGLVTNEGAHSSKDMSALFEPIGSGSKTTSGNVGIVTSVGGWNSTDLADIFAGIGTVSYLPNIIWYGDGSQVQQTDSSVSGSAFARGYFNRDGSVAGYSESSNNDMDDVVENWCADNTFDVGDDFEIKYTNVSSGTGYAGTMTTSYQTLSSDIWLGILAYGETYVNIADITIRVIGESSTEVTRELRLSAHSSAGGIIL